jgi:cytochrome c
VALAATYGHADGDAVRRKALYESRCIACHSIEANRVDPAHKCVFGRKAGSVAGYTYSDAVRNSKIVWDASTLDLWLSTPAKLIAGQKDGLPRA